MQHSVLDSMLGADDSQKRPRKAPSKQLVTDAAHAGEASAAEASDGDDGDDDTEAEPAAGAIQQLPEADKRARPVFDSGAASSHQNERELPTERTVFVRGMPLDTTSQQLQAAMTNFGPVKACR